MNAPGTVALVAQLNEALTSRSVVDQARDILMARTGCNADEAIDTLKQRSQRGNRKLRAIVADAVDHDDNSRSVIRRRAYSFPPAGEQH